MTADTAHFRWSDAWLFLAIGYSNEKGESSLARVIGVADAIQHAVLTWEEVDGGLFRLGKAGYVTVRDGKAGLTQQGRTIFDGLQTKEVLDRQDELARKGNSKGTEDTKSRNQGAPRLGRFIGKASNSKAS